jgi:hypothetical protein
MQVLGVFLFVAGLAAQPGATEHIVRGTLVERDAEAAGVLLVRIPDNHVHSFQFDARTDVKLDGLHARIADLQPGDTLEIVAAAGLAPRQPYARAVKATAGPRPARMPPRRGYERAGADTLDGLFPRGSLMLTGRVSALSAGRLTLRTQPGGETHILLRADTRYLREGASVTASRLAVNTRVLIRAGRNLDGDIEAYQVVWGEILKPE